MADGSYPNQLMLKIEPLQVVDLFAGGGGASEGLEQAFGIPVHVAVNHKPLAIAVHRVNHPATTHHISDVYEVCPHEATGGKPVGHLHASPDCTHHSQAKGGQPRDTKSRSLTWVIRKWAGKVRPLCITMENVQFVLQWGPLIAKRCSETGRVVKLDGTVAAKGERVPVREQFLIPCKRRQGSTWRAFVASLKAMGYVVDWRTLAACDYGVPTTRQRLYMVARRDGAPIQWPSPTHGDPKSDAVRSGQLLPWRTAAECIDFDRSCPSIFMSTKDAKKLRVKRPLADATLRRIARGARRFVLDTADPFIVPLRGTSSSHTSVHAIGAPLSVISAGGTHHGLVMPSLVPHTETGLDLRAAHVIKFRGQSDGHSANEPMPTVTSGAGAARPAGAAHALGVVQAQLVPIRAAHMEQANTGLIGHDMREPASTITTSGSQQRLVVTEMAPEGTQEGRSLAVYRFLKKYLPPKDLAAIAHCMHPDPADPRRGYVAINRNGEKLVLTDISMRMLVADELKRCQGFPDDYVLDQDDEGNRVPQHSQVALIGNSVCASVLEAIVRTNCKDLIEVYRKSGVQSRPGRMQFDRLAA